MFLDLCIDGFSKFMNPWQGSVTDPGRLAVSVYSGIYSYSGWSDFFIYTQQCRNECINNRLFFLIFRNYLNFMTEELRNPYV